VSAGLAMAYDAARGRTVLFGSLWNTTWQWDGSSWTGHAPNCPTERSSPVVAYDTTRQRTFLFGGAGEQWWSDTWEWDGSSWLLLTPPVTPPLRSGHAMVYDTGRRQMVLFGGSAGLGVPTTDETWEWDGRTWTQRTPAIRPVARTDHAMAYDAARRRVVLFGGTLVGTPAAGDTWEWDGTAWTQATPATSPPGRSHHAMAYDPVRQRVVLFGGYTGSYNGYLSDTWEWDGTNWVPRASATSPPAHGSVRWDRPVLAARICRLGMGWRQLDDVHAHTRSGAARRPHHGL